MERKAERALAQQVTEKGVDSLELEIERIREAHQFIKSRHPAEPKFNTKDLSAKVLILFKYLRKVYQESDSQKCIVFVRRRYTAKSLYELLKDSVSPNLRLGILVGSRKGDTGDEKFTFREQMLNVSRFRRGKLNCLIATSVAEEGLDVPDCNIVIRFDLYMSMIQYIQSRGRARHSTSRYLHMHEKGNREELRMIKDCLNAEATMREFCQSLPEDRLLDEKPCSRELDSTMEPHYFEEATGARLTFSSAMQLISTYTGSLVSLRTPFGHGKSSDNSAVSGWRHPANVCCSTG